jgi:hypothetical protein
VDPKKIEAMKDWSRPKTLKISCGFLGLNYYHIFFQNYGKVVAPLISLLKRNAFSWMPEVGHSFHALKYVMCTNPILTL